MAFNQKLAFLGTDVAIAAGAFIPIAPDSLWRAGLVAAFYCSLAVAMFRSPIGWNTRISFGVFSRPSRIKLLTLGIMAVIGIAFICHFWR